MAAEATWLAGDAYSAWLRPPGLCVMADVSLQIAEAAEQELRAHERSKEQLCQELNLLVHQSATAELNKLEQLTKQLDNLNGSVRNCSKAAELLL